MGSSLARIAELIGQDAALRLCRTYGGVSYYIPHCPDTDHAWARVITRPAWEALCAEYGGTRLTLPRGERAFKRQKALELLRAGRMSVRQIALECQTTERNVSRLRAKMSDDRQAPLPFNRPPGQHAGRGQRHAGGDR